MSWAIGYDGNWKRDIGYGVPAECDHEDCNKRIDRGLAYVCGQEPYGGEYGCGLYFCGKHLLYSDILGTDRGSWFCEKCSFYLDQDAQEKQADLDDYFTPKPDVARWIRHKLKHHSWQQWRDENQAEVATIKALLKGRM